MVVQVIIAVAFIIYIAIFTIFRLEPKITIAIALSLLVAAAISLVSGFTGFSNQLANYGYFFLITGVLLLLIHQHFTVVPNDKLKEWLVSRRSHLGGFKSTISGMVLSGLERVGVRRTHVASRVAEKRLRILVGARLERKDQMMQAQAIQDELRKKSRGGKGAGGLEK